MLKELTLHHFAIAKSCTIQFEKGFNVLSGETGAGKTMLMQALSLLLGAKSDMKMIRKGEESALVKGVFSDLDPQIYPLLKEHGIPLNAEQDLLIERELSLHGKNRLLINAKPVTLPLLKLLAPFLIEIISQHSQLLLKDPTFQRSLVDAFGNLEELRSSFTFSFLKEKEISQTLTSIQQELEQSKKHLPLWEEALKELQEADLKEGEEEEAFQEYKKLSHLQELLSLGHHLFFSLSEDPSSILDQLKKVSKEFDKIVTIDPTLTTLHATLNQSVDGLAEVSFQLSRYMNDLEQDPQRFQEIESRLTLIKGLKKKYGSSFQEIQLYQKELSRRIEKIYQLESSLTALQTSLHQAENERKSLGTQLSTSREAHSKLLAAAATKELQQLNMPHAQLLIQVTPSAPTANGCDEISFDLIANLGEEAYPIKEQASGGELSRILFVLKLILAKKQKHQALVFDEIDANVGGTAATLLGEELRHLGTARQVICITHFPQVAAHADHHLHMCKQAIEGRVFTEVKTLSLEERQQELLRMMGGTSSLLDLASSPLSAEKS